MNSNFENLLKYRVTYYVIFAFNFVANENFYNNKIILKIFSCFKLYYNYTKNCNCTIDQKIYIKLFYTNKICLTLTNKNYEQNFVKLPKKNQ